MHLYIHSNLQKFLKNSYDFHNLFIINLIIYKFYYFKLNLYNFEIEIDYINFTKFLIIFQDFGNQNDSF